MMRLIQKSHFLSFLYALNGVAFRRFVSIAGLGNDGQRIYKDDPALYSMFVFGSYMTASRKQREEEAGMEEEEEQKPPLQAGTDGSPEETNP